MNIIFSIFKLSSTLFSIHTPPSPSPFNHITPSPIHTLNINTSWDPPISARTNLVSLPRPRSFDYSKAEKFCQPFKTMGKKLSQASVKITKKSDNKKQQQQQHQLNSLIKVLRPKVYITDSSSFKSLVQELTGNGGNIPLVSSPPPHPVVLLDDHVNIPAPVIEIDDDITTVGYNCYQQGSPDFSSLASSELSVPTNSLTPSLDYYCSPEELGIHHQQTRTMFNELDSCSLANNIDNDDKMDHLSQYRNVESWLLEMDPFVNSNYEHGYVPLNISPEACMYDYELSGLII